MTLCTAPGLDGAHVWVHDGVEVQRAKVGQPSDGAKDAVLVREGAQVRAVLLAAILVQRHPSWRQRKRLPRSAAPLQTWSML